jgi:hypothetical protein
MMLRISLFLALLFSSTRVAPTNAATYPLPSSVSGDDDFTQLVAWMRLHGGRVDHRIDVAEMNGIRGIVALEEIGDGAELLHCSWNLVIGSTGLQDQMQLSSHAMCKIVQDMADEIKLGSESLWWPYLKHIEIPRLSAMWGQSALDELQGLSPSEDATRHIQWFTQSCAGGAKVEDLDQETMHALVSFITRASEVGMVPIYDLINHHNGKKNAKLILAQEGVHLRVVDGPIKEGQEIFLSYGVKSSSTMYRDYGFVEDWPSIWNWKDQVSGGNLAFVLLPDGVAAINPTKDFLMQIWHSHSNTDIQSRASSHMKSLPLEESTRFATAVRDHRNHLPTTLTEDLLILEQKQEELLHVAQTLTPGNSAHFIGQTFQILRDSISAIEYRILFKKALQSALVSAENAAEAQREKISGQEF